MTHTHYHAGQLQQPERVPETDGAKCCQQSDQVGPYLTSTHQMAPPKRGRTHLIRVFLRVRGLSGDSHVTGSLQAL